jgi:hypothetical protein
MEEEEGFLKVLNLHFFFNKEVSDIPLRASSLTFSSTSFLPLSFLFPRNPLPYSTATFTPPPRVDANFWRESE